MNTLRILILEIFTHLQLKSNPNEGQKVNHLYDHHYLERSRNDDESSLNSMMESLKRSDTVPSCLHYSFFISWYFL